MSYARKLILHASAWDSPALVSFVEACIADGVSLLCVVGEDCATVEDVIDELVIGDGSDPGRFIQTSSHPGESLEDVKRFAQAWNRDVDSSATIQEVRLSPLQVGTTSRRS